MKIAPQIPAAQILYSQGFGSRRDCAALLKRGALSIAGSVIRDAEKLIDTDALHFSVDDCAWQYTEKAYIMLHKPAGTECSAKPSHWPSVFDLLPAPLRNRPVKGGQNGVQAVGRLDQDATGMLLLSDDGQFIHRLNSPKHHVQKIYEVTTAEPISAPQVQALIEGVEMTDTPAPVRAAACVQTGAHTLALTLTEGKYHQVKRMIAAAGNHVVALHRAQIGALTMPPDLAPGQWRWLAASELARLSP